MIYYNSLQKSNEGRFLKETVLLALCNHSQVEARFIVVDISDHEDRVPFILVSNDTGFAPVSIQDQIVICVINKCVYVKLIDDKRTFLSYFPVNLNIIRVELGRLGENTRCDHV